jgi:mannose-6-phosphate isomerase-like protein (cupin superfamily)
MIHEAHMLALIAAWQPFFNTFNWQEIITNYPPKKCGCGLVYELPNFLDRPNESCAIADMRDLPFAEPHYHPELEIYFVLEGSATLVIGTTAYQVKKGDSIVIPPNKAHFTIPDSNFIIGVINTPPFNANNYVALTESNSQTEFDYQQFKELVNNL